MTAVLDAKPAAPDNDTAGGEPLASWGARAGAFTVDVLLGAAVIVTLALLALTANRDDWVWWVFTVGAALVAVAIAVNRYALPGMTGWSVGRAYFGIAVRPATAGSRAGRPATSGAGGGAGILRLLLRDLAHLLDTVTLFVGWFWPLWDRRRRTFADMLARTEVLAVPRPERDVRRPLLIVLAAAVVVCTAAITLCYLTVYRHERAVDTARTEIAEQGPRIVEKLLTYRPDSMQQDFSDAQQLATDAYRGQLIAQQQAVAKGGAVGNEYWAVSSAVLSVSPDRAAMLLAMQGQRGEDPKTLKFITATVRADFDRSADGRWRVNALTVLKRPQMAGAGQ